MTDVMTHSPEDTGSRLYLDEGATQRLTPPGPRPSPLPRPDLADTMAIELPHREFVLLPDALQDPTTIPPPRPLPPTPGKVLVPVARPADLGEYLVRRSVPYVMSPDRARHVPRHRRPSWLARRFGGAR